MYGFLYVLLNLGMPGLLKIGQSERHPMTRAAELSDHTGVPFPFELAFFVEVTSRQQAEKAVHEALAARRVNEAREFFRITIGEARNAIENNAAPWLVRQSGVATGSEIHRRAGACCTRCHAVLQFTPLTRHVGGFCSCGAEVAYAEGQEAPSRISGRERGVVLPRCGICRSRMVVQSDSGVLRCTYAGCVHETRVWR